MKKKNLDNSQDEDEKEHIQKKPKYLNHIDALKFDDDEKRRKLVAKQMVQEIFKKNYGEDSNKILEKNFKEIFRIKNEFPNEDIQI
ncbi:hypothetical protein IMG5_097110 [Ichthyophthirius multifiliis]|uniref:Uncharacterized protein n=1 Tax=Ichthyophthirius multifiliis TaxID=5932 RepID=G0QRQ8_ICHMU|nr:hypothetical protein IMG5_097110 [Ichthyophthirius multifiliis]EGR32097.1 hypothetical protein IMG5_097110 [Ichthyophthirius multifiliis]|eukprot:XP_004035583.1 hypothetical protein IMG5_097110 [Ichthyophthirius multifiliis]